MSIYVDTMCIGMKKQKETEEFVWYKFEVSTSDDDNEIFDEKGGQLFEKKYGVFRFNKLVDLYKKGLPEGIFILIEEETDPVLVKEWLGRLGQGCFSAMHRCKREGKFPESTGYQCG